MKGKQMQAPAPAPVGVDKDRFVIRPCSYYLGGEVIEDEGTLTGVGILSGEVGSGKSFVALDLAFAVALGIQWCNLKTVQGDVRYFAAEGATGLGKRTMAYALHNNIVEAPLFVSDISLILDRLDGVNGVIKAIQSRGNASLIIVDGFSPTNWGDSYEDRSLVARYCRKIHEQTGASVLLVHDTPLPGRWDFAIKVKRNGHMRSMTVTRSKYRGDSQEFRFRLATVSAGKNENGEDITSCVVNRT